jgi:hypothetical protein
LFGLSAHQRLGDMEVRGSNADYQFNCWRFRASKPYFMHTLSFSVMQYVIIRPLLSIVGLVCEYYNVVRIFSRAHNVTRLGG